MTEISAWVEQQINERERIARACTATDWRHVFNGVIVDRDTDGWQSAPDNAVITSVDTDRIYYNCSPPHAPDADHIVANDPDTVLARCAADRKILAYAMRRVSCSDAHAQYDMYHPDGHADMELLRMLAQAYGQADEQGVTP